MGRRNYFDEKANKEINERKGWWIAGWIVAVASVIALYLVVTYM